MSRSHINFRKVKEALRIEEVAANFLRLELDHKNRAACPACKSKDRPISIDVDNQQFSCHAAPVPPGKKAFGGDVILLVSHIQGIRSQYDAAQKLIDEYGLHRPQPSHQPAQKADAGDRGEFGPLDYLVFDHEDVRSLGFAPVTAQALGIGFAPRGSMRGCVVIPVWIGGKLSGYVGLDMERGEIRLPKEWSGLVPEPEPEPEPEAETVVVPFKRRAV